MTFFNCLRFSIWAASGSGLQALYVRRAIFKFIEIHFDKEILDTRNLGRRKELRPVNNPLAYRRLLFVAGPV